MKIKQNVLWILAAAVLLSFMWSCGSSEVTRNLSAEDRFALGMKKFNDGDYLEAISDFDVIKLQFPGSRVADSAQYYLGECRFKREEYLLAAQQFQALRRNIPASPLVPFAMYETALCYYELSPRASLDQQYTRQAIDEFQTFIEYNPKNELVHNAEAKITELNTRLAKKLYEDAELYMKLDYHKAATIYYGLVVDKYHDTPYAEPALLGKVRSEIARKRYDDARVDINKFFERYPNSSRRAEAESLRNDIDNHLRSSSAADGLEISPLIPHAYA